MMAYSKKELLDKLTAFQEMYGRYPTRMDFRSKKITPSKNAFYAAFGNMPNASKQAGLYSRGLLPTEEEKREIRTSRSRYRYSCPWCGSNMQRLLDYATCSTYIRLRFIRLLKKNPSNTEYMNAVFDCSVSVFGADHRELERAFGEEGFLDAFSERLKHLQTQTQHDNDKEEIDPEDET